MSKCFWIYVVSLLISLSAKASDIELKNLRWDWQVYDQDENHYVPYFKRTSVNAIRFELELNKYRNSYLKLSLPEKHFVWIQDELVFTNERKAIQYFSIDSLRDVYDVGRIHLTIYNSELDGNDIESVIVNREDSSLSIMNKESNLAREKNERLDLFIIISIAVLSLIAIFRSFNFRLFQEYFSIGKALQLRQNFDLIIAHAALAWPNIGFILFYSILVGSSVVTCDLFLPDSASFFPFSIKNESSLLLGLKISGFCFLLMVAKLLLISASSELFKLNKIRLVHFFTYFRLSIIIALAGFSFSVVNGIFGGILVKDWWDWVQLFIVVFWSARLLLIYFVLNKIYTFRKLHLFSYLCSSELIPLLLFFKIFLK